LPGCVFMVERRRCHCGVSLGYHLDSPTLRDGWLTRLADPALYQVSVRNLAALTSGFFPTLGHPHAVAVV
jgi:hypothetical protein